MGDVLHSVAVHRLVSNQHSERASSGRQKGRLGEKEVGFGEVFEIRRDFPGKCGVWISNRKWAASFQKLKENEETYLSS